MEGDRTVTPALANVADYLAAVVRAHRGAPGDQHTACVLWARLTDEERAVVLECEPLPEWER